MWEKNPSRAVLNIFVCFSFYLSARERKEYMKKIDMGPAEWKVKRVILLALFNNPELYRFLLMKKQIYTA